MSRRKDAKTRRKNPNATLWVLAIGITWSVAIGAFGQYTDAEFQRAIVSIARENRCGLIRMDPTDVQQCPTYSISISGDGTVTYEGKRGVRTIGRRTHAVDAAAVRSLVSDFERAGFFGLQDRYDSIDLGGGRRRTIDHAVATTVTLSIAGRTKSVLDFYGTPDIVRWLERRIDEVSDSQRYTGRPLERATQP